MIAFLRNVIAAMTAPRYVCSLCGCEPDMETGCCCYYIALQKASDQKDMIGRLTEWQRQGSR